MITVTHAVENVHPSLHGDALKHGEHGEQDVVKVSDAKVGSGPVHHTPCPIWAKASRRLLTAWPVSCTLAWEHKAKRIVRRMAIHRPYKSLIVPEGYGMSLNVASQLTRKVFC